MEIRQISLHDEGPTDCVVAMSVEEALYLALITGNQTGITAGAILPGGEEANHEIYECLSSFFNRFYDGGVAEAKGKIDIDGQLP